MTEKGAVCKQKSLSVYYAIRCYMDTRLSATDPNENSKDSTSISHRAFHFMIACPLS